MKLATGVVADCLVGLKRSVPMHCGPSELLPVITAATTVLVYWLVQRRRQQTSCNTSSMQLHKSCRTVASTTEVWLSSVDRLYTGSMSPTESGSGYASRCTSVSRAWLPDIWPSSVNQSPTSMVTDTCGQLDIPRVRLSTYGGRAFCYAGPSAWNALPDFKKAVHFLYLLLDVS